MEATNNMLQKGQLVKNIKQIKSHLPDPPAIKAKDKIIRKCIKDECNLRYRKAIKIPKLGNAVMSLLLR